MSLHDKIMAKPLSLDVSCEVYNLDFQSDRKIVSQTLQFYCTDQVYGRPDRTDRMLTLTGLTKRLANATPGIKPKRLHEVRRFARKHIHRKFDRLLPQDIYSFEEWLAGTIYPGGRKRELTELYQRLSQDFENEKRVNSFLKDEGYPEFKVSRWINSSPDEFKVIFGPIVHSIEKKLFEHESFIKTVPVEDRANAIFEDIFREGASYVETDFTSFEAHFTKDKMKIWHDFIMYMLGFDFDTSGQTATKVTNQHRQQHMSYEQVTNMSLSQATLFCLETINGQRHLKMRNFGSFQMIARRCSGEMDTSSGNGYTNKIMMDFSAFKMETQLDCKVEGDDGLGRYAKNMNPDDKFFFKYGWDIKLLVVRTIEAASFCGLRFDRDDKIVVCDIIDAIAKFGLTNGRYAKATDRIRKQLTRAKALSLCCQFNQVPILGALARRALKETAGINIRKSVINSYDSYKRQELLDHINRKPWEEEYHPPQRTRELVQTLYNITPEMQVQFERDCEAFKPEEGFRLGDYCPLKPELEAHSLLADSVCSGLDTNINKFHTVREMYIKHWGDALVIREKPVFKR